MVWNDFGEFLRMGGYGLYVWGSVLVCFGFMFTEPILLKVRRRAVLEQIRRRRNADETADPMEDAGSPNI